MVGSVVPQRKRGEIDQLCVQLIPDSEREAESMESNFRWAQQKVLAIARRLMANLEMLMSDEPWLGLAPILVEDVFITIVRIHGERKPVLLREQHFHEAFTYCSRVMC